MGLYILHPIFYLKKKMSVVDVHVSVCLMSVSVRPSVCVCLQKKAFSVFVLFGGFLTAEGNISELFMYIFSLCH